MNKKGDYNVIFIMADQMKATASSLYSEIGVETPNLKRMKDNLLSILTQLGAEEMKPYCLIMKIIFLKYGKMKAIKLD